MVDRGYHDMDSPNVASNNNNNGEEGNELLPPDFVPGKWDVICQRGKECFEHGKHSDLLERQEVVVYTFFANICLVGNRRFRMCIDSHLDNYVKVKSRQQKSKIVTSIVQNIRKAAAKSGGGFVRKDLLTRRWFKVDDKLAREKVGQALRDAIKTRRAADKKQTFDEDTTTTLEHASCAVGKSDTSLPRHLHEEKTQNELLALDASLAQQRQQLQYLQQQQQHQHQQQQPKAQLPTQHYQHSNFGGSQFFNSQLSADLEPTPIPQSYNDRASQNQQLSGANNATAHLRSEFSASTLLRLYESGGAANLTNNNIFEANRDIFRRNLGGDLYAASSPVAPFGSERIDSSQLPAYQQQLLPTVIERRQLSEAASIPAHHSNSFLSSSSSTTEELKMSSGLKATTESSSFSGESSDAGDASHGKNSSYEV